MIGSYNHAYNSKALVDKIIYAKELLTNCTFSGLLILGPRRPPPLVLLPSDADAAENRVSSSDISISGALTNISLFKIRNAK